MSVKSVVTSLSLIVSLVPIAAGAQVDLATAAAAASEAPASDELDATPVASTNASSTRDAEDARIADLYCRRQLGTWFYCDRSKAKPKAATPPPPAAPAATTQLAAISRQLDELKARAILEPTTENITSYIRFQREQLDRSSTFSDMWQRTIWQNSDLDYTLQRPVSTLGKRAWIDNRAAERAQTMARLSERYGVFYFYAQSCAACEIQSPILKSLADSNRLQVVAVSMDGGPNRVFPNYLVDSGQRARMGLTDRGTPALVLFDTVTKRPIPIGTGLMAADEIMDRIFVLTNTKPGSDY